MGSTLRWVRAAMLAVALALVACGHGSDEVVTGDEVPVTTAASSDGTELQPSPVPTESDATDTDASDETPTIDPYGGIGIKSPPPFVVRNGAETFTIHPYTFCYTGGCADGVADEARLQRVGASSELTVSLDIKGWKINATLRAADDPCPMRQSVDLERIDETMHRLRAPGHPGEYIVDLFASPASNVPTPNGGGDSIGSFRWTTTAEGVLATPSASLGVLAEHDGALDSYGVELSIMQLGVSPSTATATIKVTGADGRSVTLSPKLYTPIGRCAPGQDGILYFRDSADEGKRATKLGLGPFEYEVTLTMDSTVYVATAAWPTKASLDPNPALVDPSVKLTFTPPLPSPT
jgi:hypothetical protein